MLLAVIDSLQGNDSDLKKLFSGTTCISSMLTSFSFDPDQMGNATKLSYAFYNCLSIDDASISNMKEWNVGNVTAVEGMFLNCPLLTYIDLSGWNTSKIRYFNSMLQNTYPNTLNISSWDLSLYNDSQLFLGTRFFNADHIIARNVKFGTAGSPLYGGDASLTESIDLTGSDFSALTNMNNAFGHNPNLRILNLDSVSVGNITDASNMISYCPKLKELDLSAFDFSSTSASLMFLVEYDTNLERIYVSPENGSWHTPFPYNVGYAFRGDINLVGGRGTVYDAGMYDQTSPLDYKYACIDDPDNGLPGYFTSILENPHKAAALENLIENIDIVSVSDDGADIYTDQLWTLPEDKENLDEAISKARVALEDDTIEDFASYHEELSDAIDVYNAAKMSGLRSIELR